MKIEYCLRRSCWLALVLIGIIFSTNSFSQGLDSIIVEKYYVSDKVDSKLTNGSLPEGSVTYRIYVDMAQGYNLQSVFGSPGHEMILSSSTNFFNHSEHGSYIANLVFDEYLSENDLMLDSWISMGAGSQLRNAILKAEDDTAETFQNTNSPKMLQSKNPKAGIPLIDRDGLLYLPEMPPRVTQVGLDSLFTLLDKMCTTGKGFNFITSNGGWGCVGGAKGVDSHTNRVCIGQFTTDGDFYFELNIQIGSPEHGVEQYVAKNPQGKERLFTGLIYSSKKD